MQTAQVIPFKFEAREVRTLLIEDQPWFVAADVAAALNYRMAADMVRNLDDDERGTQIVRTPSKNQHGDFGTADQEMLVINESGLYSAILRSRKAEAKRFKKWVTAEVLPAIRKHGRYEDQRNQMGALVLEAIGVSELTAIKGVIKDKAKQVPKEKRRSFMQVMHQRLRTRFNVPRTELIPHKDFADACNFVAAYAIEGEYLPAQPEPEFSDWLSLGSLIACVRQVDALWEQHGLYRHLTHGGSRVGVQMIDYIKDGRAIAGMLNRRYAEKFDEERRLAKELCARALPA